MFENRLIFLLIVVFNYCAAYKLLVVFPIPGKSHAILGEGYVRHLLNAGHEVTYITYLKLKDPPPQLRQIDVSSNYELFPAEQVLNLKKMMTKEVDMGDFEKILQIMYTVANGTIMHNDVQKLIQDPKEEFDAVIAEWMYSELYSGFSSVFNCPLIWSSSMEPHAMVLSIIDESPNPAYTADHMTSIDPPFNFRQRISELWTQLKIKYNQWLISDMENETYMKAFGSAVAKRGRPLPPYNEVKYNGSIMLGNSHVSSGQAVRLPQNYIPIAGYHIGDKIPPLPKDLQKIMDESKNGVIYFSMGSMLRSNSLPDEIKHGLMDVFAGLNQTVIWKFEEMHTNLPKNVHILNWAPQQSILAHKNCVLFITHGGLLSTTETLHFGVPIIGIPMFADQFTNVNRAIKKGFAKRVDLNFDTPINLKAAIEEMINNPRYSERVKELSFVYHHRPVSPGKELVHWVEHVVQTKGAPHLRSPALHIPWYQKAYLDFVFVTIITLIVTMGIIKYVITASRDDDLKKKLS